MITTKLITLRVRSEGADSLPHRFRIGERFFNLSLGREVKLTCRKLAPREHIVEVAHLDDHRRLHLLDDLVNALQSFRIAKRVVGIPKTNEGMLRRDSGLCGLFNGHLTGLLEVLDNIPTHERDPLSLPGVMTLEAGGLEHRGPRSKSFDDFISRAGESVVELIPCRGASEFTAKGLQENH